VGRLRGRVSASGRPIDLAIAHVWTVRAGQIVPFVANLDTPAVLTALAGGAETPLAEAGETQ